MKWRICFEAEQQGRGRQERGGVKELDGLKQSFQCKVLQLHFEAEEERMVDSEEIF